MLPVFLETFSVIGFLKAMLRRLLLVPLSALTVASFAADAATHEQVATLFRQRQWPEAQALLLKVTATEPDNAEAWNFLGQSYLKANDWEKALPPLEKATVLAPANSEYQRILGDACGTAAMKAGLFSKPGWAKKCKAAYEKSVELDPKNLDARWSVMEFYRQAPGFLGGGMEGAYAQAAEIQKLDVARGRMAYATLYVSEKKFNEAFGVYETILKDAPDDYGALANIGRLADVTGERLDQGIAALKKCLSLTPPPNQAGPAQVQWRLGNIYGRKGDKAAARAAYEASLQVDPKFTRAADALKKL